MKKLILIVSVCLLLNSTGVIAEEYYPSPTSTDADVNRVLPNVDDASGNPITDGYSYDEETRVATITDSSGGTEKYEIVYTPYEIVDEVEVTKIKNLLDKSHTDVSNDTDTYLVNGLQEKINYFANIDVNYENKTPSDLIVLRLFDVSVLKFIEYSDNRTDTTREYITLEEYFKIIESKTGSKPATFTMSIRTTLPKNFIVAHDRSADNVGEWEIVEDINNTKDMNNYYTYGNGVLTITTTSLSCYAIFGVTSGSVEPDTVIPYTGVE